MSIDICKICECFFDSDEFPGFYRECEELNKTIVICDSCVTHYDINADDFIIDEDYIIKENIMNEVFNIPR